MSWVSGAYASGPVVRWAGAREIKIDISQSDFAIVRDPDVLEAFGTDFGTSAWSNPLDGGRCEVSVSSQQIANRPPTRLADQTANYFATNNLSGSWVAIDFDASGAGHRVNLDAFAWQHVDSTSTYRLRSFLVEAGNGANLAAVSWQTIGTISEDGFIRGGASGWSTVRELVKLAEPYRFVRFTQTGTNSNGSNFLLGSEVVFGGSIFPGG